MPGSLSAARFSPAESDVEAARFDALHSPPSLLENFDRSCADGELREYLRPIQESTQCSWTGGLVGNDDGVAGVQLQILEGIAPGTLDRAVADHRTVGTNDKNVP